MTDYEAVQRTIKLCNDRIWCDTSDLESLAKTLPVATCTPQPAGVEARVYVVADKFGNFGACAVQSLSRDDAACVTDAHEDNDVEPGDVTHEAWVTVVLPPKLVPTVSPANVARISE